MNDSHQAWDIPPGPANPRNSEGAFITLKSGSILFLYTYFYGTADDHGAARIVSIRSDDQGVTWSTDPQTVIEHDKTSCLNVMSPSLLRLHDGRIALVYLRKVSFSELHPWICFSADEGETWSAPILIIPSAGYYCVHNDRLIQTRAGRLILPASFHRVGAIDGSLHCITERGIVLWYVSDDGGETWQECLQWWSLPVPSKSGMQEPGVVELEDGVLLSWARTDVGCQYACSSYDGGDNWATPVPTRLFGPLGPASIKRIPGSKELLALYAAHYGTVPFPEGLRTPYVAAISFDGGKTWPKQTVLEADPGGCFCYTAIEFSGDNVLLGYVAGSLELNLLGRTRIRKLSLAKLREV